MVETTTDKGFLYSLNLATASYFPGVNSASAPGSSEPPGASAQTEGRGVINKDG